MDDLRKARLMAHTPVGRQTARNLGLPMDEAEIQAAEFSSDHWKDQARGQPGNKGQFASGSGGSGKSVDAADEKKKKEPWEMTPDEYERSFHGATFGDWYMTPDGKFGQMQGHGSLGSGRVGVVGVDGERIGWYDRSALRLVHKDQRSSAETDAASKWIAEVSEKVSGLKKEHESLLLNKKITDRLKNAVSSGQMSQSQYDAAKAKGTVLSDADYAKAVGIEKQIEDARNAPIAVPVNKKHRELVSSALAEGKTVPPEVLANYPDLADKAKEKPARITTKPKPVKKSAKAEKSAETHQKVIGIYKRLMDRSSDLSMLNDQEIESTLADLDKLTGNEIKSIAIKTGSTHVDKLSKQQVLARVKGHIRALKQIGLRTDMS